MRFGLFTSMGAQTWSGVLDLWRHIEATGWDIGCVTDHFMPNTKEREGAMLESWSTLSALAALVPRVRVGTIVLGNTYRHPAVVAKMAAQVDIISGGRLLLGLGAGWQQNEHEAYGIPFGTMRERLERLDEACQVMKALWSQRRSDFKGRYYQLADAPLDPKPVQTPHPELMIGGGGERVTLRIVAKHAGRTRSSVWPRRSPRASAATPPTRATPAWRALRTRSATGSTSSARPGRACCSSRACSVPWPSCAATWIGLLPRSPRRSGRRADGSVGQAPAPLSRRAVLRLMAAAAGARPRGTEAAATMRLRPIPQGGETIPAVGLGTWRTFDVGASAAPREPLREVLQRFFELGGRVIDSSPMYGAAEGVVGDLGAELGILDALFLATKVWMTGRDAGVAQMEQSLRHLRRRRLDLMQIHNLLDWRTHLRTLRDWKEAGRIRYLGVTHYAASAYDELERVLRSEPLDFVQVNYSLGERAADRRILPLARDRGIAVLVNRPFSEGDLFRRVRGRPLPSWAAEFDCASWAQFFLKWILAHPAVTCVIPATSQPQHLVDNMKAGVGALPDPAIRERMGALAD